LYGEGKTSITHRFKEAQRQVIADQLKKDRAIDKMKLTYRDDVHPGTPIKTTTQVKATPTVEETAATEMKTPAYISQARPHQPAVVHHHTGGAGDRDQSPSSAPDRGSPGRGGHHWAKGGRVRYTNGGIVGLL